MVTASHRCLRHPRYIITTSDRPSIDGARRMTFNEVDFSFISNFPQKLMCSNSLLDYIPSKQALPFLPKTAKCLKPGHLAKVIARNGRVVVGRVRYIGPLVAASADGVVQPTADPDEAYVGLQLPNNLGDCDGSIDGKKFFEW